VGFDDSTQTVSFPEIIDSLTLSGVTETIYTVTVTYTGGDGTTQVTSTDSFTITIKNPCIDPNYVFLTAPTMPALSYTIASGAVA